MERTILPAEKIKNTGNAQYKRFVVPMPEPAAAANKKLQFFYIGSHNRYIDTMKDFFEFGYTSVSVNKAIYTLKRLLNKQEEATIPDMIVAEAALGKESLLQLHRFLSSYQLLADVPFIVEATGLPAAELTAWKRYTYIDEIIFLHEFNRSALLRKVNFLKKTKQQRVHSPASCKVEVHFPVFPDFRSFLKRALDLVFSSLLLLVFGPVMLLIALAIKLESGGPVLYISKRTGRGYRIFDFYKFRTMMQAEDEKINELAHLNQYDNTIFHKFNNDPRVTKVGLFLRKTSLDELPQLVNVLLGDMSLVGNRPLPLYEAARLTTNEWAKRFMAPAGMTGLWQIRKRGKHVMSVEERISLDNDYADKSGLLYDFWIMANTPPAIIQKTNA